GPVVGPRQRRVASSVGSIFLSPALDMLRLLSAVHRTPASLGLGQIPTHGSRCQYTRVAGKDLSTPSGPCGSPAPNSPNTPPPKEVRGMATALVAPFRAWGSAGHVANCAIQNRERSFISRATTAGSWQGKGAATVTTDN